MPAIEVKNLKKYFGPVKAVDDISFEVNPDEIFGFLGPNGAGETTTIRCFMDFLRPDAGQISILGFDPKIKVKHLSTGNKQKLAIILALISQPAILILA